MNFFDRVLSFLVSLNLPHWAAAGVVVVISLILTLGLKHLLMRKLIRASSHTHLYYDSLIFRSLSRPLTIVLLGAHLLLFERLFDYLDVEFGAHDSICAASFFSCFDWIPDFLNK